MISFMRPFTGACFYGYVAVFHDASLHGSLRHLRSISCRTAEGALGGGVKMYLKDQHVMLVVGWVVTRWAISLMHLSGKIDKGFSLAPLGQC